MPTPESIAIGKDLRHSIAALSGSPASEYDLSTYFLCRKTLLSHDHLLELCAIHKGNIRSFTTAIGFKNRNQIYKADNGYWIQWCKLLSEFIPVYEIAIKTLMNELATLPQEEVERLVAFIGISVETLTTLTNNAKELDDVIIALRPSVVRMAELNVMRSVLENRSVRDSKWVLEHADTPYNTKGPIEDPNTVIEIIENEVKPQR